LCGTIFRRIEELDDEELDDEDSHSSDDLDARDALGKLMHGPERPSSHGKRKADGVLTGVQKFRRIRLLTRQAAQVVATGADEKHAAFGNALYFVNWVQVSMNVRNALRGLTLL
jgi:hypothetical protein